MSEGWAAFVNDPRTVCRYGAKCYQKNPEHHKTYKHPPQMKRKIRSPKPDRKRFRLATGADGSPKGVDGSDDTQDPNTSIPSKDDTIKKARVHDDIDDSKGAVTSSPEDQATEENTLATINLPEQMSYHEDASPDLFKELFLVEMPQDFFLFFKCLQADEQFEKTLASVNLQLIGPFDLLMGKLPVLTEKDLYLIHWRFFYDPPEFQAVLKRSGKSEFHIGYFRDDPNAPPAFLAANDSAKDCQITPVADNIFATVYLHLEKEKKTSPFISVACQRLVEKVKRWAEDHNFSLEPFNMKTRLAKTVTKTLHGAGIVVPFNKKTELGYRKLVETDANLKKLFKKLEESKTQQERDKVLSDLQPVITYANIAVDECDFGTGLEAGIALFCSGHRELQPSAISCLTAAYSLLNRDAFGKIIQAHLKYRRKGPNMSILSNSTK